MVHIQCFLCLQAEGSYEKIRVNLLNYKEACLKMLHESAISPGKKATFTIINAQIIVCKACRNVLYPNQQYMSLTSLQRFLLVQWSIHPPSFPAICSRGSLNPVEQILGGCMGEGRNESPICKWKSLHWWDVLAENCPVITKRSWVVGLLTKMDASIKSKKWWKFGEQDREKNEMYFIEYAKMAYCGIRTAFGSFGVKSLFQSPSTPLNHPWKAPVWPLPSVGSGQWMLHWQWGWEYWISFSGPKD